MERKPLAEINVDLKKGKKYLDTMWNVSFELGKISDEVVVVVEPWGSRTVNRQMLQDDIRNGRVKIGA